MRTDIRGYAFGLRDMVMINDLFDLMDLVREYGDRLTNQEILSTWVIAYRKSNLEEPQSLTAVTPGESASGSGNDYRVVVTEGNI